MKKQNPIIDRIPTEVLEKELTEELFLCNTNKAGNEIYVFSHDQAPNLMKEVGRLREISFRDAGGGSGKSADIDKYDVAEVPFKQLIVWDPKDKAIIGGYRYILGNDTLRDSDKKPITPTSKLFNISDKFINQYWNKTIELGRSFVQPLYRPSVNRKGIFSLDNLWDGLGAIVATNSDMKYFFGKFTMYPSYDQKARDILYYFLDKHFHDFEGLIIPKYSVEMVTEQSELEMYFNSDDYSANYKELNKLLKGRGEYIPPLVNAYINLSNTMKVFGTSLNSGFGDVLETAILISIGDISKEKYKRYIGSYLNS